MTPPRSTDTLPVDRLVRDRKLLVELCVDLHDRLPSAGLRDKLRLGLEKVGVELLAADGERFDPSEHQALGEVPTQVASLADTIATTQLSGYRDQGRLAREPAVLVYRLGDDDDQR